MIRSWAVARAPRHQPIASTHHVAPAAAYGAMCPAAVPGSVAPSTAMSKGRLPASSRTKPTASANVSTGTVELTLVSEGNEYAVEAGGPPQSRFARPPAAAPEWDLRRTPLPPQFLQTGQPLIEGMTPRLQVGIQPELGELAVHRADDAQHGQAAAGQRGDPGGVLRDILYLTARESERQHDAHALSGGSHGGGSRYRARNRPFRVVVEEVVPQVYAVPAAVLGEHRQLHERGDAPKDADVGQSHGVTY